MQWLGDYLFIFLLKIKDCAGCRSFLAQNLGSAAAVLFIVGLLTRRKNNFAPQVIISSILVDDLEKSASRIQLYT